MKKIFIVAFFLAYGPLILDHDARAESGFITLVNETSDMIQHIDYVSGMNLYDVALKRTNPNAFTDQIYLISAGKIQRFKISSLSKDNKIFLVPSDVVIFGTLLPDRKAKLRQNQEIDNAFRSLPNNGRTQL